MIARRLYLQICLLVFASLVAFALLADLLWEEVGHERYESVLFDKTTGLASLLLPPAEAPASAQAAVVQRITEILGFEITLWSADRSLIASSGPAREPAVSELPPGEWRGSEGDTYWTAHLPDGRWLVIFLDRIPVPSERSGAALRMIALALFMSLIMFPLVRHLTRRLEHLQDQVVRIGKGDLAARVDVRGRDEVALLAASFNASAERVERLVAAQRMLLANASHELRTPLARIRMGIEMLQSADTPARRQALQKEIAELDALIDELILMVRLDSGLPQDGFQSVDLLALIAEEAARYRDCDVSGKALEVSGDYRMLQHLVRNLIDNAHLHGAPPVTLRLTQQDGAIVLLVTDGGSGIPDSEKEKVLQPFYRATGKQNLPGYGLGLALVRKIAELHGGTLSIRNRPRSEIKVTFAPKA